MLFDFSKFALSFLGEMRVVPEECVAELFVRRISRFHHVGAANAGGAGPVGDSSSSWQWKMLQKLAGKVENGCQILLGVPSEVVEIDYMSSKAQE